MLTKPLNILLVCLLAVGLLAALPARAAEAQDLPPISPVATSTPNEDGSITHVVQYGETLIDIVQAYGITLRELYDRNRSLNPEKPSYFEGQVLIIRPAFTPTPLMTETYTPAPPTRTPLPTSTPRPTYTPTTPRSPTPTITPTETPLVQIPTLDDLGETRPILAYAFIGVSLVGLVALAITSFWPRRS